MFTEGDKSLVEMRRNALGVWLFIIYLYLKEVKHYCKILNLSLKIHYGKIVFLFCFSLMCVAFMRYLLFNIAVFSFFYVVWSLSVNNNNLLSSFEIISYINQWTTARRRNLVYSFIPNKRKCLPVYSFMHCIIIRFMSRHGKLWLDMGNKIQVLA